MNKKQTVAIIGLGGMGLRHCEASFQLENVDLVSVCDINKEVINNAKLKYNIKNTYTNWEEMISNESIDLLIIATNGDSHHDITIFASNNNIKNIICEKPITTSLIKANNMLRVCTKNNTNLVIHHIRRWSDSYAKLKQLLQEGIIGDIRQINFEMGGGQLASNGGHLFDLTRYLTGKNPTKTIGFLDKKGTPNPRGPQFKDPGGYGIVWLEDDIRVFFDMSEDYGTPFLFKILGQYGYITVDEKSKEWRIHTRKNEDRSQPLTRRPNLVKVPFKGHGMMDMVKTCKKSILDTLNNNTSCSGIDGFNSLMIPIGIHKSNQLGNSIINFPLQQEDYNKEYNFT